MDEALPPDDVCPIARGLARVGDKWSMLILRNAGAGHSRFDQFQTDLGIAPNILTRRLSALVADGLLERHRYRERPPRDEYRLTIMGREFLPILYAFGAWGTRHFANDDVSQLVDEATGRAVEPVVYDRVTARPILELTLSIVPPGGDATQPV